jgi:hypothetical protein
VARNTILILIIIQFFACSVDKEILHQYKLNYDKELGRSFVIPSNLQGFNCVNQNRGFSIVSVYDAGCSSCVNMLLKWQKQMDFQETNVRFILTGVPSSFFLENIDSNYPYLIQFDSAYSVLEANAPFNCMKETVLLAKDSTVILIGDPVTNEQVRDFYKYEISRE